MLFIILMTVLLMHVNIYILGFTFVRGLTIFLHHDEPFWREFRDDSYRHSDDTTTNDTTRDAPGNTPPNNAAAVNSDMYVKGLGVSTTYVQQSSNKGIFNS